MCIYIDIRMDGHVFERRAVEQKWEIISNLGIILILIFNIYIIMYY